MVLLVKQICNVLLQSLLADPTRKFDQLFPPPPPLFSFRIVICFIQRVIFFYTSSVMTTAKAAASPVSCPHGRGDGCRAGSWCVYVQHKER